VGVVFGSVVCVIHTRNLIEDRSLKHKLAYSRTVRTTTASSKVMRGPIGSRTSEISLKLGRVPVRPKVSSERLRNEDALRIRATAEVEMKQEHPSESVSSGLPDVAQGGEMPSVYDFDAVEQTLYKWWETSGYFKPEATVAKNSDGSKRKSYVIPMPPPNVTGYLHMGHALFVAVQDILARFHRMIGDLTLYLPGTDHAGIATQLVVEKELAKQNLSRHDIGRDAFLEKVWEWKNEKGGYIMQQMRRLGASADWERQRFTLDPDMSNAVNEAFVRLHEKGLIYRGDRMVNWSPNLETAVSDLEVEYEDRPNAKLYTFKYQLADDDGFIPVATTRPETILGDTAVCVHPEDERYKSLVGKEVIVPITGRRIPVIADDYVDMEFGTGALKITPAHDPNDYEIGKRHNLPSINIMTKKAAMNSNSGKYEGLDRYKCRDQLWKDMENEELTLNITRHPTRVPISQRGGEMIEPMVSTQWFVKTKGMADASLAAVREGEIEIVPPRFEKMWDYWLEDIRDWCISRQLWWGHRIPVWHVKMTDGSLMSDQTTEESEDPGFIVARSESDAYKIAREKYGEHVQLSQDEDVLDTWFSSGLWPFATVGWPNESEADFKNFYPAAMLETGYDILFFWVARMVMMGKELTGKSPFSTIYLHGLVRDAKGKKMSKTAGNVIDPIETVDNYGADALRFSLVTGGGAGQDVPLSMEKIEGNRNFANKLWNAGRYLVTIIDNAKLTIDEISDLKVDGPMKQEEIDALPLAERYIVSRLHQVIDSVTSLLQSHRIAEAGSMVYDFFWNQYTNWYIEASKIHMSREGDSEASKTSLRTLVYVFDSCLRLLHPFMPYITETLWQRLPHNGDALMISDWPRPSEYEGNLPRNENAETKFGILQEVVNAIRSARAEYKVEPGKKIKANIVVSDSETMDPLREERDVLAFIARVEEESMQLVDSESYTPPTENTVKLVIREGLEAHLPLSMMVDAEKEKKRLTKQAEKIQKDIDLLDKRLSSPGFVDKAPKQKVDETRAQLDEKKAQISTIMETMSKL